MEEVSMVVLSVTGFSATVTLRGGGLFYLKWVDSLYMLGVLYRTHFILLAGGLPVISLLAIGLVGFLVKIGSVPKRSPKRVRSTIKLDELDGISSKWINFDILVFNTGHWWNRAKLFIIGCYFKVGGRLKLGMSTMDTYTTTLNTWASWVETLEARVNGGEGTSQRSKTGGQTGQHGGPNGGAYGRLTKFEFPKFDGEEVETLNWHKHFMSKFRELVTWEVYQIQVKKRFELVFEDLVVELTILRQTTSVQVYQDSFGELLNKVDVKDAYAVSLFIGGLKEEIAYVVRMFKTTSLSDAFCLAKLQKASNSITRGRPTTVQTASRNMVSTPYNRGGGSVTKNVVNLPVQTNTVMPNRPFKRLTKKEMEEKRAKQLCFYCDQKYSPGHKCRS
ncbi:reverse transcriptase [Tanacetum coccineum]